MSSSRRFKAVILLLFSGAVILLSLGGIKRYIYPLKYENIVERYSDEYGVDTDLVYAVIKTESNFDPKAVSEVGAKGLMQITDETFEWLMTKTDDENMAAEELFCPETNIRYGILLLSILQNKYNGDESLMLCAYHAGSGSVSHWLNNSEYSNDGVTLEKIPKRDTQHYVNKVTRNRKIYNELYNF